MNNIPKINGTGRFSKYNPVRFVKSLYYANKPVEWYKPETKKISLGEKVVNFVKGLYNANKPVEQYKPQTKKVPLGEKAVNFIKGLYNANRPLN